MISQPKVFLHNQLLVKSELVLTYMSQLPSNKLKTLIENAVLKEQKKNWTEFPACYSCGSLILGFSNEKKH